ncbi:MAG: right-handed parallel beta-helix repeat-containing protein [Verrucomicrobia bacterium]|nr:right-handed parallel beta-helix repeat-containing protein [Verrucomicrobiota bacterium]
MATGISYCRPMKRLRPPALTLTGCVAGLLLFGNSPALSQAGQTRIDAGQSIEVAAARLEPGDTLVLKPGIYRQSVTLAGLRGERKRPITLRGEVGAVIEPSERDGILIMGDGRSEHLVLEGITVRGAKRAGIVVNGSRHVTIRNCSLIDNGIWGIQTIMSDHVTVEDCQLSGSRTQHGVYFSTTDHPILRRCHIFGNAGCGAHFNGDVSEGGDGMITGAILEDNVIHDNGKTGGAAINMDGVDLASVRNNLIFNNLSGGITSFRGNAIREGDGHVIADNTVYMRPSQGRFAVQILGAVTNVTITRNVLVAGRGPALDVESDSVPGITSDGNLFYMPGTANVVAIDGARMDLGAWHARTGQDVRSRTVNPAFANPAETNFTVTVKLRPDQLPIGYQPRAGR